MEDGGALEMEIYDDLTGEAEEIMKQTIKAAKTKPKSDFLGSKINNFDQLCLRVGGLCWWAGIAMRKEAWIRVIPAEAMCEVSEALHWGTTKQGFFFWYRLDRKLEKENAYHRGGCCDAQR
jgi:hypothetical protein